MTRTNTESRAKSSRKQRGPVPVPRREGGQLLSWKERYAAGKDLRERCARDSHAAWKAPPDRMDLVQMVLAAEKGRVPELLPLRHGRMVRSAFTFYHAVDVFGPERLLLDPDCGFATFADNPVASAETARGKLAVTVEAARSRRERHP